MPLPIPTKFKQDIQGSDTSLIPLIKIGEPNSSINISTQSYFLSPDQYSPLLLNIPSISESIDITHRKYKINNITISISNYKYNNTRFSDLSASFLNLPVRIYWVSPSATNLGEALLVYFGRIKNYNHDSDKVSLVVEDRSQTTLHRDLPTQSLDSNYDAPERYRNKPIPICYGVVNKSPCVISYEQDQMISVTEEKRTSFKIHMDYNPINSVNRDAPWQNYAPNTPHYGFLYILIDDFYYRVIENWSQKTTGYSWFLGENDEGEFYQWSQHQIDPSAMGGHPDGNWMPTVSMVAQYTGNSNTADNSLASEVLEVDFVKVPNSVTPTLIGLSSTEPGNQGGSGSTEGPVDGNNLALLANQDLGRLIDMNPETYVELARHTTASTNDDTEYNGMGFIFKFPSLGIDPTFMKTVFQFSSHWYCWSIEDNPPELNFHAYDGHKIHHIFNYNGVINVNQHYLTDNLFADNYFAGYTPGGTFDTSDSAYSQPLNWDEWLLRVGADDDELRTIDYPLSIYQFNGQYTNDLDWKWKLYGLAIYHYMHVKKPTKYEYFANIDGRVLEGPPEDVSSYGRSTNVIHQVRDILDKELNVHSWGSDTTQFESWVSASLYMDQHGMWEHSYTVSRNINSKRLLEQIASTTPFILRFDSLSNFRFILIPHDGAIETINDNNWIDEQTIKSNDCISYRFKLSDAKSVYSKVVFKYNFDYGLEEFQNTVEVDLNTSEVKSVLGFDASDVWHNNYHKDINAPWETTLVIDDDRGKFIRNPDTAKRFAFWTLMWYYNNHIILDLRLSLKYMVLDVGDVVNINELLGGITSYGIDYTQETSLNGQTIYPSFLVVSTKKSLKYIDIQLIQLHQMGWPDDLLEQYPVDQWGSPVIIYPTTDPQINMARASDTYSVEQFTSSIPNINAIIHAVPLPESGGWGTDAAIFFNEALGVWVGGFTEIEKDEVYFIKATTQQSAPTDLLYNAAFFEDVSAIPYLDV